MLQAEADEYGPANSTSSSPTQGTRVWRRTRSSFDSGCNGGNDRGEVQWAVGPLTFPNGPPTLVPTTTARLSGELGIRRGEADRPLTPPRALRPGIAGPPFPPRGR